MRKVFVLVLLLALLLFSVTSANASDIAGLLGGLTEVFGMSGEEEDVYVVGETADVNGICATLDSVLQSEGSSDLYLPDDGNIFLICEFTIENQTDEDFMVSSMLCFSMKCDGKLRELSLEALSISMLNGKIQLDQAVEPGGKISGVVGYEVPKDWKNFELKFTPDPWGSGGYAVFSPYDESSEDDE